MRKAQIEMIGLVIIVIIILFALMFYFRLNLSTEPREKIGYEQLFSSNLINVILDYKPRAFGCEEKSVSNFLSECKRFGEVSSNLCEHPCGVRNEIISIVNEVMIKSGFNNYYFRGERAGDTESIMESGDEACNEELGVTSPKYSVSGYEFYLKICK